MADRAEFVKPVMDAWLKLSVAQKANVPKKLARALDALCQSRFFIGKLCDHGHRHEGKEASLRYVSNTVCVQCTAEHSKNNPSVRASKIITRR
jgi:hypothetical protein